MRALAAGLGLVVLIGAVIAVERNYGSTADEAATNLEAALIEACERKKQDRVDNARAWTRAAETWKWRLDNGKVATREERAEVSHTARVYNETANQLRSRILQCEPLIKDGESLIDERLLREAQGDL